MKNIIEISVCPIYQQKEEKKESTKEFIVKMDDCVGDYLESLLTFVDKHTQKYDGINFRKVNRIIEYGDYILFTKDDVRIFDKSICPFSFGKTIYSLVDEYYTIKSKVKDLFNNNGYKECPYYKAAKKEKEQSSIVEKFLKKQHDIIVIDSFIEVPKKESFTSKLCKKCLHKVCR
jgi:hypothetical protein